MEPLRSLEKELMQCTTRSDKSRLENLIHPEFIEIGYTGLMFSKKDIISDLLNEQKSGLQPWSQNFRFVQLGENTVQLIYQQARMSKSGALSRHAMRCSIWQAVDQQWQIRFHQGTPCEAFVKSTT